MFLPSHPDSASGAAHPILTGPARSAAFRLPAYVAALLGSAALLAAPAAQAQTTYTDATNGTANFSGAFSPAIPAGGTTTADTLVFSSTATSSQTDDLANATQPLNANALTFSNSAALTLLQGAGTTIGLGGANATVNLNNTGTVRDNLILALQSNLNFAGAGNATFTGGTSSAGTGSVPGGGITGAFALVMNGTGILTLDVQTSGGTGFAYTGGTFINSGTLQYGSSTANNVANKLGTGTVFLGNTTGAANATLQQIFNSDTLNNNIVVQSGNTGVSTIFAAGNTALGTFGGTTTITLGSANSAGKGLTFGGGTILTNGVNALIQDPTGLTAGTAGTVTIANSNAVFSAANTYTGATVINAGAKLTLGGNTNNSAATATGSLSTSSAITDNGTLGFNRTNAVTQGTDFASVIGGTGGVLKLSTNTLTLNGANTYSGGTVVSAGTLTVGTGGTLGAATGALAINNANTAAGTAVTVNLATAAPTTVGSLSGTLATASSGTNTNTINNGGQLFTVNQTVAGTYAGTIAGAGGLAVGTGSTAALTLTGANTYTGATTISAGTLQLGDGTSAATDGTITGTSGVTNNAALIYNRFGSQTAGYVVSGTGTVTKLGAGTQVLTGANTYTGNTTVSAGALTVGNGTAGSITPQTGAGTATSVSSVIVGNTTTPAVLNINSGTLTNTVNNLNVGTGAGASALNISSGTLTANGTDSDGTIGVFGAGGYGALNVTGGALNIARLYFGSNGTNQVGVGNISGGTVTTNGGFPVLISRGGGTAGVVSNVGDLTVSGGTLNVKTGQGLGIGFNGAGRAELNVTGGLVDTTGASARLSAGTGGQSVANLNAGTLQTNGFVVSATGTNLLNFNGGTLQAGAAGTLVPAVTGTAGAGSNAYVNGAFGSFAGGAVINTNGFNTTVAASLAAPTGSGVSSIAVAGGTGYVGAPYVAITGGGGTGATAIANVNAAGNLTGITITNPGVGFTGTPTVTLVGGGGTGATVGAVGTAANTSGGLTKNGTGILMLTAANTFTGPTTLNAGALTLTSSMALSDTGLLTIANGTAFNLNAANGTTEIVGSLILGGVAEAPNTYTAAQLMALDPNITFSSLNGETLMVANAVPEPSTWAAGLLCLGALGLSQRRRVQGWLAMRRAA